MSTSAIPQPLAFCPNRFLDIHFLYFVEAWKNSRGRSTSIIFFSFLPNHHSSMWFACVVNYSHSNNLYLWSIATYQIKNGRMNEPRINRANKIEWFDVIREHPLFVVTTLLASCDYFGTHDFDESLQEEEEDQSFSDNSSGNTRSSTSTTGRSTISCFIDCCKSVTWYCGITKIKIKINNNNNNNSIVDVVKSIADC